MTGAFFMCKNFSKSTFYNASKHFFSELFVAMGLVQTKLTYSTYDDRGKYIPKTVRNRKVEFMTVDEHLHFMNWTMAKMIGLFETEFGKWMGELFLYSKLYFYKFQCLNVTKTA